MLNSTSLREGLRMHAAALLAAGMVITAAAPPLAGQQEVVDTRVVIMNVTSTEEGLEPSEEELASLNAARDVACNLALAASEAFPEIIGRIPVQERSAVGFVLCSEGGERVATPPTNDTTGYTIYIRENRMAVHAEGFPVMVWRVIPGTGAQMYFYDPETGRIQNFGGEVTGILEELNLQDPDGRLNLQAADRTTNVSIDYIPRGPSLLGADGERLGYPVHRYELGHQMVPEWARNAPFGTMRVYSDGGAWIAHDTPYNEVVGRFFENFAAHVDSGTGGMLAGLTASMAQLGRLGVPMETVDTSSVRLTLTSAGVGPGNPETGLAAFPDDELILEQTVTKTEIKDIRFGRYEIEELEGIFGPEPPSLEGNPDSPAGPEGGAGGDSCDCSCDAFREFQDLDENDPGAMAQVMCAQQCVSRWISCAGPGCNEL